MASARTTGKTSVTDEVMCVCVCVGRGGGGLVKQPRYPSIVGFCGVFRFWKTWELAML